MTVSSHQCSTVHAGCPFMILFMHSLTHCLANLANSGETFFGSPTSQKEPWAGISPPGPWLSCTRRRQSHCWRESVPRGLWLTIHPNPSAVTGLHRPSASAVCIMPCLDSCEEALEELQVVHHVPDCTRVLQNLQLKTAPPSGWLVQHSSVSLPEQIVPTAS